MKKVVVSGAYPAYYKNMNDEKKKVSATEKRYAKYVGELIWCQYWCSIPNKSGYYAIPAMITRVKRRWQGRDTGAFFYEVELLTNHSYFAGDTKRSVRAKNMIESFKLVKDCPVPPIPVIPSEI